MKNYLQRSEIVGEKYKKGFLHTHTRARTHKVYDMRFGWNTRRNDDTPN